MKKGVTYRLLLTSASSRPILSLYIKHPLLRNSVDGKCPLTEDNFMEAIKMLGSTLLVALMCYPIFSSELLIGVLLTFPELYLSMIGLLLLLGRWIGLRVMEHFRFSPLMTTN